MLDANFWKKVVKHDAPDGCWEWVGAKRGGYGRRNRHRRGGTWVNVHHEMWQDLHGPVPPGMVILHACDNPACVRPDHLSIGTQKENVQDMLRKGRGPDRRGERNGRARITADTVRAIRADYAGGVRPAELSRRYALRDSRISEIVHRKTWRDV